MKSLCVFCGASTGTNPVYRDAAAAFGQELARRDIELVWGGGHVGLMGVVADAVLDAGGRVYGVIPSFMVDRELAHPRAQQIIVTADMHTRKAAMAERAEAFVALPGGFGTLDELFEILTWAQLQLHNKPIGLLNVQGFFDPLLGAVQRMQDEGFLRGEHATMLHRADDGGALIDLLESLRA
ncbi:MAG: TIGR00730 family Rossman fold protein [Rhodocyclaceae bacterium]